MNETLRITLALALLSCLATREARAQGFVDVSAALGTDAGGRPGVDAVGGGVSVIDLDGDGRLDILAQAERGTNELRWWKNEG